MAHVRIKICGITSLDDAVAAERFGADALGFNFYHESPRYVAPEAAKPILRDLSPFVEPVAVFVNESWTAIWETLLRSGYIKTFQWHGDNVGFPFEGRFHFVPAFAVRDASGLQA